LTGKPLKRETIGPCYTDQGQKMSENKSSLASERPRKSLWKLGALLWPFATSAVAINLFMLGLLGQAIGLPALSPIVTLWWSLPLGLPATYAAARWVRHLIAQAS